MALVMRVGGGSCVEGDGCGERGEFAKSGGGTSYADPVNVGPSLA